MLAGKRKNTRLQISVTYNVTTKVFSRDKVLDTVSAWSDMFIEYYEAKIQDIILW